jgi:reverse gyrase
VKITRYSFTSFINATDRAFDFRGTKETNLIKYPHHKLSAEPHAAGDGVRHEHLAALFVDLQGQGRAWSTENAIANPAPTKAAPEDRLKSLWTFGCLNSRFTFVPKTA